MTPRIDPAYPKPAELERLCGIMHDAYEAAATVVGWETQQASRRPWADVPEPNKASMRAALTAVLNDLRRYGVIR